MASNLETSAANILQRAVEMDSKRMFTEALVYYREGIQLLMDILKSSTEEEKRTYFRGRIESYMERAENLKKHINKEKSMGVYHEQTVIEDNSIGHSYQSVFGRFFDSEVTQILLEDPYIRTFHQCHNLLRFCELAVKSCKQLKTIEVLTSKDGNQDQMQWLQELKEELNRHSVGLVVKFSPTLHDRQIKLIPNGWIIKIGRGLDYFKPPKTKFSLGYYDFDLRPCHQTTVDVFHEKDIRMSHS